ncbi:MAG: ABC transporter permease [Candidatus Thorarchaeota archaeon]|nr:MAG: ABC transporter permease [Candidatus Thorarchaeota archaeon]RLI59189.1 MAG: ABC transporter permease [Candidatus Thorarchaeota archaeon]
MSGMAEQDIFQDESPRRTRELRQRSFTLSYVVTRGVIPLIILLAIWQLVAFIAQGIGLIDIASAFVRLVVEGDADGRTLMEHTGMSMFRVTLGFTAAIATAIPLGIAIGRYRAVDAVLGPVVEAMRPIPPIAWIPLSILMFRTNVVGAQVFIIWIGSFFPILINTTAGVKRTDPVHLDVAHTFGATEAQILAKVVLPSAAPEMFAGLRLGFGIGWMCLVAAEMIGGGLGLGYLVIIAEQLGRTGETISAMLVIGAIGFMISYAFLLVEKRLLRWRREVSI